MQFFFRWIWPQAITKHKKLLDVVNKSLFRNFFDFLRNRTHKQLVVPETTMANIIKTMPRDPMQGHPCSSKMLHALRQRFYSPNLAEQVQSFVDHCENCIKEKPYAASQMKPPLQRIFDYCDGLTDIMEIDLVAK